jgi:GT2 family glycosyltransferase
MNPRPNIDIVIPCAGRQADLLRLLDSLVRHAAASMRAQVTSITVTDDRPSDTLREALAREHPRVRYVHGPARGPAANRNHGARFGSASWILFLDDDCYVDDDLLRAYATWQAEDSTALVFEGAIHPVGDPPDGSHHAPLNLSGGKLWSCNMLVARTAFAAVGGFDDRFPFACREDVDLAQRLRRVGCRIVFARTARVFHPWRALSGRELTRQLVSHAIYADKHPEFVRAWSLGILARMLVGRWRKYAWRRDVALPAGHMHVVAYDLLQPLALFAVVRLAILRSRLSARHRNPPRHETSTTLA